MYLYNYYLLIEDIASSSSKTISRNLVTSATHTSGFIFNVLFAVEIVHIPMSPSSPSRYLKVIFMKFTFDYSESSLLVCMFFLQTTEIRHVTNDKCLDVAPSKEYSEGLVLADCDGKNTQKWKLESVTWK